MEFLADQWLGILLSAVFVFVASSIIHMCLPIHTNDYGKMPGEDKVLAAMREQGVKPGDYMFPCPGSKKDMGSPEHLERCNTGPVGFMNVLPDGPPNMGKALLQWFLFSIVISIFSAYMGAAALGASGDGASVFRITGTTAFVGHGMNNVTHAIWKGEAWSTTWKFVFDGLVYALVTGATFAWLW